MHNSNLGVALACALSWGCAATSPVFDPDDPYDSGGPLLPEQAAYDVRSYDLSIEVDPERRSITGSLGLEAVIGSPLDVFVLDLDRRLAVSEVSLLQASGRRRNLAFERREGKLWVKLPRVRQPGEAVTLEIAYGGSPREAPHPPWEGGFTWAKTADGHPWIATTCQGEGADIWWPVKDHVSDEPEHMDIRVTVPEPLVVAANGRLESVERQDDGGVTYHWHVSTPINSYNVALNIAPYETIEDTFTSVAGDTFPVVFYFLPEARERAAELFDEIIAHLRFFEELLGPYPFRADKYGVAQTPHLGMEHQTIIAYGANFDRGAMTRGVDWGFDVLHHHELSHEWWGNLVTNADWNDMWLHEGFGSYMQPLYLERTQGTPRYHEYMESIRPRMGNRFPVAPRESRSTSQIYGSDIYFKGAWILHTLRYLVGDETFFTTLRRMAYPTPELERVTGGAQCRFATTHEFVLLVEQLAGRDLDWFFEVYLRRAPLPRLVTERRDGALELRWEVPGEEAMVFPMPVDVEIEGALTRLDMVEGRGTIPVAEEVEPVIDPQAWVLRERT